MNRQVGFKRATYVTKWSQSIDRVFCAAYATINMKSVKRQKWHLSVSAAGAVSKTPYKLSRQEESFSPKSTAACVVNMSLPMRYYRLT